jgi:uncharacterized protein
MDTKHPFEKVVADHGATVLRVCRVPLAGPDADDAWSETFLAALHAYPDLPATANPTATLLPQGHGYVCRTRDRPVRWARGWTAAPVRHGVRVIRSGQRHTLGLVFHVA